MRRHALRHHCEEDGTPVTAHEARRSFLPLIKEVDAVTDKETIVLAARYHH